MTTPFEQFQLDVERVRELAKAKPFTPTAVKFEGKQSGYGKPAAGSKSEARGLFAAKHVNRELILLCDMIYQEGIPWPDDTAAIPFGPLFTVYQVINNKLVGLLMRARKHGLLYFEGEMLFQRRDDDKPVVLLKPIQQIREELGAIKEFELGSVSGGANLAEASAAEASDAK